MTLSEQDNPCPACNGTGRGPVWIAQCIEPDCDWQHDDDFPTECEALEATFKHEAEAHR